jgi:hypothetical protein
LDNDFVDYEGMLCHYGLCGEARKIVFPRNVLWLLDKKWRDTPRFVQRIYVCPYNFGRKTGEKESSVENHPIFAPENSETIK